MSELEIGFSGRLCVRVLLYKLKSIKVVHNEKKMRCETLSGEPVTTPNCALYIVITRDSRLLLCCCLFFSVMFIPVLKTVIKDRTHCTRDVATRPNRKTH